MKKLACMSVLISLLCSQEYGCFASGPREYYNYELTDQNNRVVYRGQTNDLHRRMLEHARDGKQFEYMYQVGGAKTLNGAKKAERKFLEIYRRNHGGQNPKYNMTNHG